MRVEFSKEFEKAVRKLSGKMLDSVRQSSAGSNKCRMH